MTAICPSESMNFIVCGLTFEFVPAMFTTSGENDPRVDPWESRKMVARLQAASASQLPVMLWQKAGEGHGIGNSFAQRVADATAQLTWFDTQLN